jgi:hypothetical protein
MSGFCSSRRHKRDAAAFAAGQNLHRRVRRRTAQRIHRHLQPRVEVPGVLMIEFLLHFALALEQLVHLVVGHLFAKLRVDLFKLFQQIDGFLHGLFDDFAHGARVVDQRFLFEIADGVAGRDHRLAVDLFVDAREDAQQRRLARAVETDDADLRAVEVGKIDVFEDRLLVVELADADHRIDDFVWFSAHCTS